MEIKCPYCKYKWECGSEMMFVTCPNCRRKVEREKKRMKKPSANLKEPLSKSLTLDKSKNINDANV